MKSKIQNSVYGLRIMKKRQEERREKLDATQG